jgi:NAD+ diphosphatase
MNNEPHPPINVFAGLSLDRNAEQRDDAEWIAAQLADPRARFVLLGAEGHALAQRDVDALRVIAQLGVPLQFEPGEDVHCGTLRP